MQTLFNVGLRAELRSSQVSRLLVQSVLKRVASGTAVRSPDLQPWLTREVVRDPVLGGSVRITILFPY